MGPKEEQKDCQNGLKIGREQVKFVNILYVICYSLCRTFIFKITFLPYQLD